MDGEVMQLLSVAGAAGVASAGVAAGFGKWVLSQVRETRDDFAGRLEHLDGRLDVHGQRLDEACTKLDKLNGQVNENTRFRLSVTDSAPFHAASLARLEVQMMTLSDRVVRELIPLVNEALHGRGA